METGCASLPVTQPETVHEASHRARDPFPCAEERHEAFDPLSAERKEEMHLTRKYISAVEPLSNYVLQVDFISGSRLLLDMKPYLDKFRFRPLSDMQTWNSAVTNGIFVRFGNVELSHDEILAMAEREE